MNEFSWLSVCCETPHVKSIYLFKQKHPEQPAVDEIITTTTTSSSFFKTILNVQICFDEADDDSQESESDIE